MQIYNIIFSKSSGKRIFMCNNGFFSSEDYGSKFEGGEL